MRHKTVNICFGPGGKREIGVVMGSCPRCQTSVADFVWLVTKIQGRGRLSLIKVGHFYGHVLSITRGEERRLKEC